MTAYNTGVVSGTYGDSSHVGQFNVGNDGRIYSASGIPIIITHSGISDWSTATSGFLTSISGAATPGFSIAMSIALG